MEALVLMSVMSTPIGNTPSKWNIEKIRRLVEQKFRKCACWFQVQVTLTLKEGKDVIGVALTGAGKTLSFWIPLPMALEEEFTDKVSFVVTPLNLLGKQNQHELENASIHAIAVMADDANMKTFKVSDLIENRNNWSNRCVGHESTVAKICV